MGIRRPVHALAEGFLRATSTSRTGCAWMVPSALCHSRIAAPGAITPTLTLPVRRTPIPVIQNAASMSNLESGRGGAEGGRGGGGGGGGCTPTGFPARFRSNEPSAPERSPRKKTVARLLAAVQGVANPLRGNVGTEHRLRLSDHGPQARRRCRVRCTRRGRWVRARSRPHPWNRRALSIRRRLKYSLRPAGTGSPGEAPGEWWSVPTRGRDCEVAPAPRGRSPLG
jgi:hypothetical protein